MHACSEAFSPHIEWLVAGVVICLERGADLHMAQLMPLPINQSIISLLTYDKTHMLRHNTELQYKKSQYESLYSMRIKKFLSAKCPV